MIKAAILGGSGYTGLEIMRLLAGHPEAEVIEFSSRKYTGQPVSSIFPSMAGHEYDSLVFKNPADLADTEADVVFLCLPHGAAMDIVPHFIERKKRVIDLSADYRLRDVAVYEEWYKEHSTKNLLADAVYGLPELHRDRIKDALIVANPGCYPTSAILGLSPIVEGGLVDPNSVIIDAKSGISGAGREASLKTAFCENYGGFEAYNVGLHRHTPEIEQELTLLAGKDVKVTFNSHLLPVSRGILSSIYADLTEPRTTAQIIETYKEFYAGEPFIRIMPEGTYPNISNLRCSNFCDIGLWVDEARGRLIVISAIDNLMKGASGAAVQNMNIQFELEETLGLTGLPAQLG